jgi:hypothetical protein
VACLLTIGTHAFAQETATEREAAREVLAKMEALEKSLDVPALVAKVAGSDAARDAVAARAKALMQSEFLALSDDNALRLLVVIPYVQFPRCYAATLLVCSRHLRP